MNEKALRVLEYNKIIDMLAGKAGSPAGKELCRNLRPSADLSEIRQRQTETTDALARIYKNGGLSFAGIRDIRGSVMRLKIGGTLGIPELLHIASTLDVAAKVKSYGSENVSEEDTDDSLTEYFSLLEPLTPLRREIRRCLPDEETVADDASPALKDVRRQIRNTNERIHGQLTAMVSSASLAPKLQDNIITMRGGRYCIPVKAEYRSQVPGMIHDQSSTGSTLFIEPMAIVKLNNDLRELAGKEAEEIQHILENLSEEAAQAIQMIESDISLLTTLDFIFARASLSRSYNGSAPEFNTEGRIDIRRGRHPLLDPHKVVPIDLHFGDSHRMLIITVPNTGGKTVSLKTIGLFTLMGQAGLHIPAAEGSKLSVFHEVFADIGDEQSIEQNLSTFSSHMTNIVSILEGADEHTLILLDELCAGTDPTEGAALATSILNELLSRGSTVMASTHYSELKMFAMQTPGVQNASCEFDVETLSPTYRILIGIPGKSNAFAISKKLGLPEHIIEEARSGIGVQQQNFEDMLAEIDRSRREIRAQEAEITKARDEAEKMRADLKKKEDSISEQREKILSRAREKAENILQNAKDTADSTIRHMNKLSQGGDMAAMEKERTKIRDAMDRVQSPERRRQKKQKKQSTAAVTDFKRGDTVKVISMGIKGIIVSDVNSKGEFLVQMGIMKSRIRYTDLMPVDEQTVTAPNLEKTGAGKIKYDKAMSVSTSLNLIGETVDEAMLDLDKYLDDAYLAHLQTVTIIHGRGTGRLRKAVQENLKKNKHVKSFRDGRYGEGENGVTIVEMK